ncbi:unnamed protein product [marine sediment metagenome]|uniref:Uncharacterized protein n=1 Tax=marine sediment metagenome TaxID=412755 RepID=X1JK29_9ZZZZ
MRAQDLKPGGKIEAQHISPEDMKRKFKVQEDLLKGLDFLSDNQLIELSGDRFFTQKSQETLNKRSMAE